MTELRTRPVLQRVQIALAWCGSGFLLVGAIAADNEGIQITGPPWAVGCIVIGALIFAGADAVGVVRCRRLSNAANMVADLLGGFAIAMPHGDAERPGWLVALATVLLVLLLGGAIPTTIWVWRSQRDERQRAIVTRAAAIAFTAVMLVVGGFVALDMYTDVRASLTPSWVLLTGLLAWFGSMLVFRARM